MATWCICYANMMLLPWVAMMRCLPQNVAKPHIIRRSRHHWVLPNIICRRQTSFKKRTFVGRQKCVFCWWGMVDSDHRSQWQQIYSLPPLAAREIPHMELVIGVEPTTCWLQISCSAIEPHQRIFVFRHRISHATRVIIAQQSSFVNTFLKIF